MKVSVDDDRCCGHGVCCAISPEVFSISDAGYAVVSVPEVPAEHEDTAREAVNSCPEWAITAS